ncbi:hypothetical protein, partial [Kaarinaea lacus]
MKIFLIFVVVSLILFTFYFIWLAHLSEKDPHTGLLENRLRPCPGSPNCVNSEEQGTFSISPIALVASGKGSNWQFLPEVISRLGGNIRQQQQD